jgi:hypothetical protein
MNNLYNQKTYKTNKLTRDKAKETEIFSNGEKQTGTVTEISRVCGKTFLINKYPEITRTEKET